MGVCSSSKGFSTGPVRFDIIDRYPFSGLLSLSIWAALTQYQRLGGLSTTEIYFLHLAAESPRSGRQLGWVLVKSSRSHTADFSLCPHVVEGATELLWVLFYKGTNPVHEGSTLRA